jgi:hypothetical protein
MIEFKGSHFEREVILWARAAGAAASCWPRRRTSHTLPLTLELRRVADVELMPKIRKGQLRAAGQLHPAQHFYSLAA